VLRVLCGVAISRAQQAVDDRVMLSAVAHEQRWWMRCVPVVVQLLRVCDTSCALGTCAHRPQLRYIRNTGMYTLGVVVAHPRIAIGECVGSQSAPC
jgi:hypothetical protein